jgi:hypothetical protein
MGGAENRNGFILRMRLGYSTDIHSSFLRYCFFAMYDVSGWADILMATST